MGVVLELMVLELLVKTTCDLAVSLCVAIALQLEVVR